jgi:hypothetical protein
MDDIWDNVFAVLMWLAVVGRVGHMIAYGVPYSNVHMHTRPTHPLPTVGLDFHLIVFLSPPRASATVLPAGAPPHAPFSYTPYGRIYMGLSGETEGPSAGVRWPHERATNRQLHFVAASTGSVVAA